jgi:hypothetical protein
MLSSYLLGTVDGAIRVVSETGSIEAHLLRLDSGKLQSGSGAWPEEHNEGRGGAGGLDWSEGWQRGTRV